MNVTSQHVRVQISDIEQAIRHGLREKNIKAVMKEKKAALVSGYIVSDEPCHSPTVENVIWLEKADSHGRRAGSFPDPCFFMGIYRCMVQVGQDRGRRFCCSSTEGNEDLRREKRCIGDGIGRDIGNGSGQNTWNGSGHNTWNGSGHNTWNGSGHNNGNGSGHTTGNGTGHNNGNGSGTDSRSGNGTDSSSGSGTDSRSGSGTPSRSGSGQTNQEREDGSGQHYSSSNGTDGSGSGSGTTTSEDAGPTRSIRFETTRQIPAPPATNDESDTPAATGGYKKPSIRRGLPGRRFQW
jgi:hypothetical protein